VKQSKEEDERKKRIQLYVFILRSIAYPFNAKQPNDMIKRHHKVTKEGLEKLRGKVEVSKAGLWTVDLTARPPRASSRVRLRYQVTRLSTTRCSATLRSSSGQTAVYNTLH
jgi:hypothetical protein